jgi:hypothetical protein
MNSNYHKLIAMLTIKHPQEMQDVTLRATRTLPFIPVEGMTLVITNSEDDEFELVLGAPRYEFAESAFVDYQEDESLLTFLREGEYSPAARAELIAYYESFGFERLVPKVVINQPARTVAEAEASEAEA